MKEIFVDTGAWLALADADDKYHKPAQKIYPKLLKEYGQLVTTNHVVSESYTLMRRRLNHSAAVEFIKRLQRSPRLSIVYSDRELEKAAVQILERYADQTFSYVDAVSFAFMEQQNTTIAFAFDSHFLTAGYLLVSSE